MSVDCTECLVPKDYDGDDEGRSRATLGFAALDIVRNYCGADTVAGTEVVVASQLGGRVCVWVRLDQALIDKGVTVADGNPATREECMRFIRPQAEFTLSSATGTTLAIRPPSLANYYSREDTDILAALGCANGAVVLCKTNVLAARPGGGTAGSHGTAVRRRRRDRKASSLSPRTGRGSIPPDACLPSPRAIPEPMPRHLPPLAVP